MLVYTNIQHKFRKENKLSCNEFVLCDMIYFLSNEPKSDVPGWCYMSRERIAEEIGLSRQAVTTMIYKMVDAGFIEVNGVSKYLKTTNKWAGAYFTRCKETCQPLQETLHEPRQETLHNNNSIYNNSNNVNTVALIAPVSEAEKKGNKNTVFVVPELTEVKNYFIQFVGDPKRQNSWPEDKCVLQANIFYDHFKSTEKNGQWFKKGGQKMTDWKAAARNFIRNVLQGAFSPAFNPPARNDNKPSPAPMPPVASPAAFVDKIGKEVQYLYGRYCEDEKHVTIISIEVSHYDWLYKHGLFARLLSPHEVALITEKAIAFNPLAATNDELKKKFCKCFAVLSAFEKFKQQGKENLI